jgi:MoaA/NifB/PqqE/SkfB family radical SAM enzyme
MINRIDTLRAPVFVAWQLTRDCDLACLHCCTESAPGRRMPGELSAAEALRLAQSIAAAGVPYVMLCGGEPLTCGHFMDVAESLGNAGVNLKIESNGQHFDTKVAERLAALPIRSVQISLDGDTQETYQHIRPGASLARAHAACRAVRAAGLPLEITFAPTRINIHEAQAVIERARSFGAFRFNTGALMHVGRAARLWSRLNPDEDQYDRFRTMLQEAGKGVERDMELCYVPFTLDEAMRESLEEPPGTLLVLPDGRVKVAAVLPFVCADLRQQNLLEAWDAYRDAWSDPEVVSAARLAIAEFAGHAQANPWRAKARVEPLNERRAYEEDTTQDRQRAQVVHDAGL